MTEDTGGLQTGDAILVVDVQNDFCPGGALAVEDGHRVVPVLNRWLEAAERRSLPIYASRDWHPVTHPSFRTFGGRWPPHCIQDGPGAAFHPDLALPKRTIVVTKGTRFDKDQYSAFDETGLADQLRRDRVKRLWVGGLAQDVCVRATVLQARKEGFGVMVIQEATRPVSREDGENALREMKAAGAALV